jgi:hypothetical protein
MPDLQSIQPVLRAGRYSFSGYACTPPETVIFSRAVNMPGGVPDQATSLTFDNAYSGVGAFGDVPEDAEIIIRVGNTSAIRGRLRVASGAASATVLQINEVSPGRIAIQDNDRIDVLDVFRLRDKLVEASELFRKDSRITYTDQGSAHPPMIIVGSGAAGFVDPATGLLTVVFDASRSVPGDVDNTGGLEYLWGVADGTITVGTDTDDTITATFPATPDYFRYVTLIVTDADNGKSSTRRIPVFSFDGVNTRPIPVKVIRYALDRNAPASATLELTSDCDLSALPEGALIYYFEREYYGDVEISYGNLVADRSNVKYVGFARRETITIDPDTDTLSLEVQSPMGVLEELAGFSQDLKTVASPATWQEDEAVTIRALAFYVWYWHTTAAGLFDLIFACTDYAFGDFLVQQAVLRAQMDEVSAGISATFTCDRTGTFIIARNLQRGTAAERNAADVTLALTARDLLEIPSLSYEHRYQYNQLILKMFTPAGEPLLSVAGGEAPAEAPDQTTFERGIGENQAEANYIASQRFAEVNSIYNGLPVPKGATFRFGTAYDVLDPAYPDWLTLTLAATTNRRGRGFTGKRFILQKVDIEANSETGTKALTHTVDHETLGTGSVTREVPPEVPQAPYTPAPYVPQPYAPLLTRVPTWSGALPAKLVVCSAASPKVELAVSYTVDLGMGTVTLTYEDRSGNLAALGVGYCIWAYSNPYHYRVLYVLTDIGICGCDDINTASPTWTLLQDNDALFGSSGRIGHQAFGSHLINGWGCAVADTNVMAVTFDNWASVTTVEPDGLSAGTGYACHVLSAWLCGHDANHLYALTRDSLYLYKWKSTDGGLTWAPHAFTTFGVQLISGGAVRLDGGQSNINIPYKRVGGAPNLDDGSLHMDIIYSKSGGGCSFVDSNAWRSTDGAANFTSLSVGAYPNYLPRRCNTIAYFTHDAGDAYLITEAAGAGTITATDDDFASTTDVNAGVGENASALNGWSPNPACALAFNYVNGGGGNRFWMTFDHGVTWLVCNLPADWTAASPEGVAYAEGSLFALSGMPQ